MRLRGTSIRRSRSGIGIAVRIVGRVPELGVDLCLELLGEGVLEPVGLGMYLVEREAEPVREVALEKPVVARDLEGPTLALRRERDAAIRSALDEPELREALRHRGRGRRAHASCGRRARTS